MSDTSPVLAARPHHEKFAHQFLRGCIAGDVQNFAWLAQAGELDPTLHELWTEFGEQFVDGGRLSPDGLASAAREMNDRLVVLIEMPPAEYPPEVIFICVAIGRDRQFRYLTLELGTRDDGAPRTVLGEWTQDNTHVSHGDGPLPSGAAFMQAALQLLAASSSN